MACNGTSLSIDEKMKNKECGAKNWTDVEDEEDMEEPRYTEKNTCS